MNAALVAPDLVALTDAYRQREGCAALDDARWVPSLKAWVCPPTPANVMAIAAMCPLPDELRVLLPEPPRREPVEDKGAWLTRAVPYAHQRHAVAAAMAVLPERGGFAMLMDMGTGKTLAALEVVSRLHAAGTVRRVLVVAPAAVVPVWAAEASAYLGSPHELAMLLGPRATRLKALGDLSGGLQIAVVNYESAWRLVPEFVAWGPDMVIADESQRIKGHATRQTKGVTAIGAAVHYRLALTGTPVTNSPLDVFAQWRYLDPSIFGTSYYAHRARYAVMGGYEVGGRSVQVVGYRRLDEMAARAHSIAYRVTKAEALDLPETCDTIVPVTLGPRARRAYDEMARESVAAYEGGETSAACILTRLLRLSQMTSGSVPRDDGTTEVLGDEKMAATVEVVEDAVSGGSKVVVFCRFRSEIAALLAHFGESAEALHGDVPLTARGEAVRRFQEDESVRVMVAQLQVGGAGITLTAASVMVFASLSFSYADYEQAKARIHRIGQGAKCTYVHVVAADTVDVTVLDALRAKRDVASLIVDRGAAVYGR